MNLKSNIRYALLQSFYWMTFCTVFPFIVMLCSKAFGYTKLEIGIVTACQTAALTIAQPVWGHFCDKRPRVKPIFITALLIGAGASLLLPLGKNSIFITILAVVILAASTQSMMFLIDTWAVRLNADGMNISYTGTRSFGSFSYAATAAVYGYFLDRLGMGIMTPVFIAGAVVVIIIAAGVKEPVRVRPEGGGEAEPFARAAAGLLRDKAYLILLVSNILVFVGSTAAYSFNAVRITELGGQSSQYGLAQLVMAMSEIPFLLIYKRLRFGGGNRGLHCAAMLFMAIKIFSMGAAPSIPVAIVIQILQGPSYGLYLGSVAGYMPELVKRERLFTAQLILGASVSGFSGICGNLLGGLVSSAIGVSAMMRLFSLLPLSGFLLFTITGVFMNRRGKGLSLPQ